LERAYSACKEPNFDERQLYILPEKQDAMKRCNKIIITLQLRELYEQLLKIFFSQT